MKTVNRFLIAFLFAVIFLFGNFDVQANTIKTTPQGGNWNSPGTWQGGAIPGPEDNVIIDAKVVLDSKWDVQKPDSCLSLTITEHGVLEGQVHDFRISSLVIVTNFINSGQVKNPDDKVITLRIGGDILNYGEMVEGVTIIAKLQDEINRITGSFTGQLNFEPNTQNPDLHYLIIGKTIFDGNVFVFAPIVIDGPAELTLTKKSAFFNADHNLTTKGILHQESQRIVNLASYDRGGYCELVYHSTSGDYMDAKLTTYGSTTHPRMTSSVSRWWRLTPENDENMLDGYYITFTYEDELLNGLDATKLEVFHSNDEGNTWTQISRPGNIQRNTAEKTISIGNELFPVTAGGGDFILALADDGIVVPPSISIAIVGRDEIRIGAPNNYKIVYWNNGNLNTDNFFISVGLKGGIEINTMLTEYENQPGIVRYDPDDMNPYNDKTYGFFLIDGLGPGEYSSFDLILDCYPDAVNALTKSGGEVLIAETIIIAGAYYVGTALLKDYLTNVAINTCSELTNHQNQSVSRIISTSIENGIRKTNESYTIHTPVKVISSAIAGDILKSTTGIDLGVFDLVSAVFQCLEQLSIEMRKSEAQKELEKVSSFDPNSKSGPQGYGDKNFMSAISPMVYTIDFENLSEATAPAYKVVIEDELDETVFDISTVEFLGMSHAMGTCKIEGNKLIWEFTGIELPPNKNPPEGEGWVTFKVNPHNNLSTGTEIKNSAVITFDLNEPIVTNETLNILDFEPPESTPNDLPEVADKRSINFEWLADDGAGSGVDFSYVYMSVNNSPFNLLDIISEAKMQINVSPGNDYRFFVLSKDNVGNVEQTPSKIVSTSIVVSAGKTIANELVKIYPNPANNRFNIYINTAYNDKIDISIFDIHGSEVHRTMAIPKAGNMIIPVDCNYYKTGIYFIKIRIGDRVYTEKLMIY